jgi:hypothetical protein
MCSIISQPAALVQVVLQQPEGAKQQLTSSWQFEQL